MDSLKFFWGLIAILLGLLLIATNAGWISTGVWWSILMLWPVALIVLGLKLLLHDNDKLFMWLTLIVVLFSVACVVVMNQNMWQKSFSERSSIDFGTDVYSEILSEKYDPATEKKLDITLSTGAVELTIGALPQGATTDVLYEIKTQELGKLRVTRSVTGNTLQLNIEEQSVGLHIGNGVRGLNRKLVVLLPSTLPFDLKLSSGASRVNADFSSLLPEGVKFSIGASTGEITLSDKVARQTFGLDAGASNLTFKVPSALGVKAILEGGLNKVTTDPSLSFTKNGDTYTTKDFDNNKNQLTLSGGVGVSNIKFLQK